MTLNRCSAKCEKNALNTPLRLPTMSGVRLSGWWDWWDCNVSWVEKSKKTSSPVASVAIFSERRAPFSRRSLLFFSISSRNFARSPGPDDRHLSGRPSSSTTMSATSSSLSRWRVFEGGISGHGSAEDMRCFPKGCLPSLGFGAATVITVTSGGARTWQSYAGSNL
jgi:hypothetical protein